MKRLIDAELTSDAAEYPLAELVRAVAPSTDAPLAMRRIATRLREGVTYEAIRAGEAIDAREAIGAGAATWKPRRPPAPWPSRLAATARRWASRVAAGTETTDAKGP